MYRGLCPRASFVEGRVDGVDVLLVELLLRHAQALAEALVVDDFSLAQEADDIVHIRVIGEAKDVVIGDPCLLFCCNDVRATFLESVIFIVQTAFK